MRVVNDLSQRRVRFKDEVLLGDHAPRNCGYGTEHADVEEHIALGRNIEMQEEVRVDDRRADEYGRERARNEGNEAGGDGSSLFR